MRPPVRFLAPALVLTGSLWAAGRMTDAEAKTLARKALESDQPSVYREALKRLGAHTFKSSKAPEREYVLFAQALLQDRLGQSHLAADTFRKLEKGWPQSPYLEEGQLILAEEALVQKRVADAEPRLRRVLASDLPVETKRQAQETLLWVLVSLDRAKEGKEILDALHPLPPKKRMSERGLVAMLEVAVALADRKQAEGLYKDHQRSFKDGSLKVRVALCWGRFLGSQGDGREAALVLRKLIQEHPKAPEANEARLALATLITDGKLPERLRRAFPTPERLVAELEGLTAKSDPARRALVLKLKIAVQGGHWQEALAHAKHYRTLYGSGPEGETVRELWAEAFRSYTQATLEKGSPATVLEGLRPEGVVVLLPEHRQSLVRKLAKVGLSQPIPQIVGWSPAQEQAGLKAAALQELAAGAHPEVVLALLPGRNETPAQRLQRAQALVATRQWGPARGALAAAPTGPDRMAGVLALLNRPLDEKETAGVRLREAEGQLARAPEQGTQREPLVIRVADLRAQAGDWRGALALYPTQPSKEQLGWVALMRATAQVRLGQKEAAKATLKVAADAEAFRPERQTLERETGP